MKVTRYIVFSIFVFLLFFLPGFITSLYPPVVKVPSSSYNGPLIIEKPTSSSPSTPLVVTNTKNYIGLDKSWKSK